MGLASFRGKVDSAIRELDGLLSPNGNLQVQAPLNCCRVSA